MIRCCVLFVFCSGLLTSGCSRPEALDERPTALRACITDRLGREVAVEDQAHRIVSLSPAATELLFALDLGPRLVGVTEYCNYPQAALSVPKMGGGTMDSLSLETILAAQPDLVLCKWDTHQPLIEACDRLELRAMAVGPERLSEMFDEAQWLGEITGHESQAATLIDALEKRRSHLQAIVARHRPHPPLTAFYEVWDDPLMTAGPNSFIGELMQLAGLENIVSDSKVGYTTISSEVVLQADPDIILAPTTHYVDLDIDSLRARPGWDSLQAVKQQRVHLISGDQMSRCGPRMLDALAEIILAVYPGVMPNEVLSYGVAP